MNGQIFPAHLSEQNRPKLARVAAERALKKRRNRGAFSMVRLALVSN
jgi:hypothetical protein